MREDLPFQEDPNMTADKVKSLMSTMDRLFGVVAAYMPPQAAEQIHTLLAEIPSHMQSIEQRYAEDAVLRGKGIHRKLAHWANLHSDKYDNIPLYDLELVVTDNGAVETISTNELTKLILANFNIEVYSWKANGRVHHPDSNPEGVMVSLETTAKLSHFNPDGNIHHSTAVGGWLFSLDVSPEKAEALTARLNLAIASNEVRDDALISELSAMVIADDSELVRYRHQQYSGRISKKPAMASLRHIYALLGGDVENFKETLDTENSK